MTADLTDVVAAIRASYDDCFACGLGNPIGLHLDDFTLDGDGTVTAAFRPRPDYGGFEGLLHGGIVATALDEIMAWAAMLAEGHLVYTGTMDLRYHRPAPVDADYVMVGRVEERRGRRFRLAGEMHTGGEKIAAGRGLYLAREEIAALTGGAADSDS